MLGLSVLLGKKGEAITNQGYGIRMRDAPGGRRKHTAIRAVLPRGDAIHPVRY